MLRDGRRVLLRPTRAVDRRALQELFHRMPEKDVQTRFFQKLSSLTDDAADHLCNVDYEDEMAFAAVVGRAEHERIVATSSYYLDPRDRLARIDQLGLSLRDIESGLVDFPALVAGRQVWLCWRRGEPQIGWWHDLDTGFSGRRPLSELA